MALKHDERLEHLLVSAAGAEAPDYGVPAPAAGETPVSNQSSKQLLLVLWCGV